MGVLAGILLVDTKGEVTKKKKEAEGEEDEGEAAYEVSSSQETFSVTYVTLSPCTTLAHQILFF